MKKTTKSPPCLSIKFLNKKLSTRMVILLWAVYFHGIFSSILISLEPAVRLYINCDSRIFEYWLMSNEANSPVLKNHRCSNLPFPENLWIRNHYKLAASTSDSIRHHHLDIFLAGVLNLISFSLTALLYLFANNTSTTSLDGAGKSESDQNGCTNYDVVEK